MNQLCWRLVGHLSRTLDPDERDAVRGDFAELNLTSREALRDLLGLIARRQAALWRDWHPWLALIGIAVPAGLLFTRSSSYFINPLARHVWIWWRYGVRYQTGLTATGDNIVFLCQALALISSSWVSGFVLGSLSRRTLWVNAALFYLSWALSVFRPLWGIGILLILHGGLPVVWTICFVLPSACLFVLPSAWGMRQGLRPGSPSLRQAIFLTATIATIDALAIWTGGWWRDGLIIWSQGTWHGPAYEWQKPMLTLALMSWPLGYLIATAIRRRHESKSLTSRQI